MTTFMESSQRVKMNAKRKLKENLLKLLKINRMLLLPSHQDRSEYLHQESKEERKWVIAIDSNEKKMTIVVLILLVRRGCCIEKSMKLQDDWHFRSKIIPPRRNFLLMFNKILNRAALKINNQVREIIKHTRSVAQVIEGSSSRWSKKNFKWQVGKEAGWMGKLCWMINGALVVSLMFLLFYHSTF